MSIVRQIYDVSYDVNHSDGCIVNDLPICAHLCSGT